MVMITDGKNSMDSITKTHLKILDDLPFADNIDNVGGRYKELSWLVELRYVELIVNEFHVTDMRTPIGLDKKVFMFWDGKPVQLVRPSFGLWSILKERKDRLPTGELFQLSWEFSQNLNDNPKIIINGFISEKHQNDFYGLVRYLRGVMLASVPFEIYLEAAYLMENNLPPTKFQECKG